MDELLPAAFFDVITVRRLLLLRLYRVLSTSMGSMGSKENQEDRTRKSSGIRRPLFCRALAVRKQPLRFATPAPPFEKF